MSIKPSSYQSIIQPSSLLYCSFVLTLAISASAYPWLATAPLLIRNQVNLGSVPGLEFFHLICLCSSIVKVLGALVVDVLAISAVVKIHWRLEMSMILKFMCLNHHLRWELKTPNFTITANLGVCNCNSLCD